MFSCIFHLEDRNATTVSTTPTPTAVTTATTTSSEVLNHVLKNYITYVTPLGNLCQRCASIMRVPFVYLSRVL